jgi:hypothetical protein
MINKTYYIKINIASIGLTLYIKRTYLRIRYLRQHNNNIFYISNNTTLFLRSTEPKEYARSRACFSRH